MIWSRAPEAESSLPVRVRDTTRAARCSDREESRAPTASGGCARVGVRKMSWVWRNRASARVCALMLVTASIRGRMPAARPSSAAATLLAELGHEVEEVSPPHDDEALARDFLTIWFAQLYAQIADARKRFGARDSQFEADSLAAAELGRAAGIRPLIEAVTNINAHTRALAKFHETYDLFLTPTLAQPPLAVGSLDSSRSLQRAARVVSHTRSGKLLAASGVLDQIISDNLSWVPYTQLANLTGRPAISVPLHWTNAGLPLGVQLVGRLGGDGLLLQVAAQLEQAQPWFHRYAELDPVLDRAAYTEAHTA